MTQGNGNRRVRAWSAVLVPLLLVLASCALASCGGSSKSTHAAANGGTNASATSTTPTPGSTTAPSGSSPSPNNGNGAGGTSSTAKPDAPRASTPIARASRFVTCMRSHGIKLPTAKGSSHGGATLDFKGIDTRSARYQRAVATCARELVGKLKTGKLKGHAVPLKGIHVRGLHLAKIHIGKINVPGLHVPDIHIGNLNLPNVHVTTPAPNLGGQENGNEPPTSTQGSTG